MTLLETILNPDFGALLISDQDNHRRRGGAAIFEKALAAGILHEPDDFAPTRVFQLSSGRCCEYFVSFWELFDHPEIYDRCIQEFTLQAARLLTSEETRFDAIAACTQTAKSIVSGVASLLKDASGSLDVAYLDYAPSPVHRSLLPDLTGSKVLILTDIVSSGLQARTVAGLVAKLGGTPIAVLTGVVTGWEMRKETTLFPEESEHPLNIPLIALARMGIPALAPPEALKGQRAVTMVRIDPLKIFPEDQPEPLSLPLRSVSQFIDDMEEAEALSFGLYCGDWHRMQIRVDLPRFLQSRGELLLTYFGQVLRDSNIIVSPFGRPEHLIRKHLENALSLNGKPWLVLPKKSSPEGLENFFLLPKQVQLLQQQGNDIVVTVVIFSVQTSDQIGGLVSLLAGYGVHKIQVLTVLNRMSMADNGFMTRLANFFRSTTGLHTTFEFTSLYAIHEYETRTLVELEHRSRDIVSRYAEQTRGASFLWDLRHDVKYLTSTSLASSTLAQKTMHPKEGDGIGVSLHGATIEGQFVDLYQKIIVDRNFSLLNDAIRLILRSEVNGSLHREWMFRIVGLALTDIGYFCQTSFYGRLCETLKTELAALRLRRCSLPSTAVRACLAHSEREGDILVLLGFLSLFGPDNDGNDIIDLYLLTYPSADVCKEVNFHRWLSYTQPRTFYAASFAIFATKPYIRQDNPMAERARASILSSINAVLQFVEHDVSDSISDSLKSVQPAEPGFPNYRDLSQILARRAKDLATLLETDIHVNPPEENHVRTRYLFRHLLNPKLGHNPVFRNVEFALKVLESGTNGDRRVESEDDKRRLEAGYQAAGMVQQIAIFARSFAQLTIPDLDSRLIYTNKSPDPGVLLWIGQLAELLNGARRTNTCSSLQYNQMMKHWRMTREYLTGSESPLIKALRLHLIPLAAALNDAISKATRDDNDTIWGLWREQLQTSGINVFIRERPQSGNYVPHVEQVEPATILCDPLLFQEALRNLISNVEHLATTSEDAKHLNIQLTVAREYRKLDNQAKPYWVISVKWRPHPAQAHKRPPSASSTWEKHAAELHRWGAQVGLEMGMGTAWIAALARTASGGAPTKWIGNTTI